MYKDTTCMPGANTTCMLNCTVCVLSGVYEQMECGSPIFENSSPSRCSTSWGWVKGMLSGSGWLNCSEDYSYLFHSLYNIYNPYLFFRDNILWPDEFCMISEYIAILPVEKEREIRSVGVERDWVSRCSVPLISPHYVSEWVPPVHPSRVPWPRST